MTAPPLVSICVPAYDAERTLADALDSALGQTYPRVEVVVVDDGSTDATPEILEAYARRGVRSVRQDNAGQCAAANRALAASRGDLVKFFDADDVLVEGGVTGGTTGGLNAVSGLLRRAQNGFVRSYALTMLLGVVAILGAVWVMQ